MKLIAIGYMGNYTVYTDVTVEEAVARFNNENSYTVEEGNLTVKEIKVKDGKFWAYDVE